MSELCASDAHEGGKDEIEQHLKTNHHTERDLLETICLPDRACNNYWKAIAHEEMNPRRRNTMEDCHRIIPVLLEDDNSFSYFGVYDGHGGRHIVDFLEQALEQNIARELKEPDEASVLDRLSRAFLITDMQSRKLDITTSGATAVVAVLKYERIADVSQRTLYVANVGDSRAVLVCENSLDSDPEPSSSGFYGRRLSYDHRAEDEEEQQRIKDAGGFVMRGRVLGILAVSRSFGDHGMKDFITACPYVTETVLSSCGECPALILACDGLWDVMSDQEAADIVVRLLKEAGGPHDKAARALVELAIQRGSADNITVVVIYL